MAIKRKRATRPCDPTGLQAFDYQRARAGLMRTEEHGFPAAHYVVMDRLLLAAFGSPTTREIKEFNDKHGNGRPDPTLIPARLREEGDPPWIQSTPARSMVIEPSEQEARAKLSSFATSFASGVGEIKRRDAALLFAAAAGVWDRNGETLASMNMALKLGKFSDEVVEFAEASLDGRVNTNNVWDQLRELIAPADSAPADGHGHDHDPAGMKILRSESRCVPVLPATWKVRRPHLEAAVKGHLADSVMYDWLRKAKGRKGQKWEPLYLCELLSIIPPVRLLQ